MKSIISLDLWGTLIKTKPFFSLLKFNFLCQIFNVQLSHPQIKEKFEELDFFIDSLVEKYGIQPSSDMVFAMLMNALNIAGDVFEFRKKYYTFFQENAEIEYLPDVLETIQELHKNYNLIIVSNTVMIPGSILKKKLSLLKPYISQYTFSDEIGISKPKNLWKGQESEILCHVGDNVKTDGFCESYGIPYVEVNNSNFSKVKQFYENS